MISITKTDLKILHLLNYPYVHFRLNDNDLRKVLIKPNHFLINIDDNCKLWLVACRHDEVIEFHEIYYIEEEGLQHYYFNNVPPQPRLENLLEIGVKHWIEHPATGIPIDTPVYRSSKIGAAKLYGHCGKFGFGMPAKVDAKSFGFGGTFFVRALDLRLAAKANFDDLEKLASVRHENICAVLDYYREDWVVLFQEQCKMSLVEHINGSLPFVTSKYVSLIYQLWQGLRFLAERNLVCERLSIRSLLLSSNGVIKVSDFWPTNFRRGEILYWLMKRLPDVPFLESGTSIYRDLWRTTSPDILEGGVYTVATVPYSFGVVAWQILSHNLLPFRHTFATMQDYLEADLSTDNAYFPGTDLKDYRFCQNTTKNAVKIAAKVFENLPAVPTDLRIMLLQCLMYDPSLRPSISDVTIFMNRCQHTHAVIHKIEVVMKHFHLS